MAKRDDLYVLWGMSPRLVFIKKPSDEITMQDLNDTGRHLEDDDVLAHDEPHLVNAAGKEALPGGTQVGITLALQNAKVAFEGRTTSAGSGSATSDDAAGTLLTDTAALFQTWGITPGATIVNFTDRSVATVLEVISQTQLKHTALDDGTDNDWDTGDQYKIWNVEICEATAGNLTAVDDLGAEMTPVLPTAFVCYIIYASTSAALLAPTELDFIYHIEGGKWHITDDDGGTMYFYKADGVTQIASFALYDQNGQRTADPTKAVRRERLT